MRIREAVNAIQSVRTKIVNLQEYEKKLTKKVKGNGVGLYEGDTVDCLVVSVKNEKIDTKKLIEKLGLSKAQVKRFYTIVGEPSLRAKLVAKSVKE